MLLSSIAPQARSEDCFDADQIHNLATEQRKCQECRLDLATREIEVQTLMDEKHPPQQFWQNPNFVVAGFTVSFALGALVVATHCLGICK